MIFYSIYIFSLKFNSKASLKSTDNKGKLMIKVL